MKSLVEGFVSQRPIAYIPFGAGGGLALVIEMLNVLDLIFALGACPRSTIEAPIAHVWDANGSRAHDGPERGHVRF